MHPCSRFVAHTDQDTLLLVETARFFVEKLLSASSNPVVYADLRRHLKERRLRSQRRFGRTPTYPPQMPVTLGSDARAASDLDA
jgi:hypothetical protein